MSPGGPEIELHEFVQAGVLLLEHIAPAAAGELQLSPAAEDFRRGHVLEGVILPGDAQPGRES